MRLSVRNRFPATVTAVASGEAMSTVQVRLDSGPAMTAAITAESARELSLAAGTAVIVLVKSTEVALAAGPVPRISIRNQLPGTVDAIDHGAVMTTVRVALDGGDTATAVITRDAADDLALAPGAPVTALVKSTEVSVALA
ncbi:TOBE domain-containing protein [Dactylosporangium sp. NPDC005572]|uniref:TOBE domain-containing protein n=1 Tax=Dactylosporangium sp. NPDC005572 TaxID=3156889 RepID=UPI00339F2229